MKNFFLPLLTIALWLVSCKKPPISPPEFVAVGVDPSGSTQNKQWTMPDSLYFQQIIDGIIQRGGGTLYVYNLGKSNPEPVILILEGMIDTTDCYDPEYSTNTRKNDSVTAANRRAIQQFWQDYNDILTDYHPSRRTDYTYIIPFLQSLTNTLSLSRDQYRRQTVLLYTDLLHHEKGRTPVRITAAQLEMLVQTGADIHICSYNTIQGDYDGLNIHWLGNYREFLRELSRPN